VNAYVKQTFGAIGYVEFAYARRGGVAYTVLQNAAGRFIRPEAAALLPPPAPGPRAGQLSAAGEPARPCGLADFGRHLHPAAPPAHLGAQAGQRAANSSTGPMRGDATARLDFVPLPAPVKDLMRRQWKALGGRAAG
jgi:phosphate transport system substrate-binding protein